MQVQLGCHKLPASETTPPPNMADPPTDDNTASEPATNDASPCDAGKCICSNAALAHAL
jgi:hypothetical protein